MKFNSDKFDERGFQRYLKPIIHHWLMVLYTLGFTLVPIFFILDYFIMPIENLTSFGMYRLFATSLLFLFYLIIRNTKVSKNLYIFGYVFSIIAGLMIAKMTVDLGGFDSSYYAGLNLVMIAVNLLIPWNYYHSILNGLFIIVLYTGMNFLLPQEFEYKNLVNNLFFMSATVIISSSINFVQRKLIRREYNVRKDLKDAKDALWGEMEVANKIQVILLPDVTEISSHNYATASVMIPADEVGGDYYDIIQHDDGSTWIGIGDVSGHGLESGLIMMMAQTSIKSSIASGYYRSPAEVLKNVNKVLIDNIMRLKTNRYMTLTLMKIEGETITFSGRHQDLIVYRRNTSKIEVISEEGTWLGIFEDLTGLQEDHQLTLGKGDVLLLYSDGVTESMNKEGRMYDCERLENLFEKLGDQPVESIVNNLMVDVIEYQFKQVDDISLFVLKKL